MGTSGNGCVAVLVALAAVPGGRGVSDAEPLFAVLELLARLPALLLGLDAGYVVRSGTCACVTCRPLTIKCDRIP